MPFQRRHGKKSIWANAPNHHIIKSGEYIFPLLSDKKVHDTATVCLALSWRREGPESKDKLRDKPYLLCYLRPHDTLLPSFSTSFLASYQSLSSFGLPHVEAFHWDTPLGALVFESTNAIAVPFFHLQLLTDSIYDHIKKQHPVLGFLSVS